MADSKAYAESLSDQYDPAGSASTVQGKLDEEVARAKAAEEANAAAAEKAQTDTDNLKTYVGTIPEGATATDVVGYVQEKTAGIATDAALAELQAAVDNAEAAIDVIEADYLKAADRTSLEGLISTETSRADTAEKALAARIKTVEDDYLKAADKESLQGGIDTNASAIADIKSDVDTFFKDADLTASAKDTLKELQDYIASDETAASEMLASIQGNTTAIGTLNTDVGTLKTDMSTAKTDIDNVEADVAELQAKFGEGTGSVSDLISAAVKTEKDRAEGEEARIEGIANQGVTDAASALAAAQAVDSKVDGINTTLGGKIDALESASHTHDNKTLLDTYKQTEVDLADAVTKKHEHLNKTILDGIDATKVSTWDTVTSKAAQADLTAEVKRATAAEQANATAIAEFIEVSEAEINALFATV